MKKLFYFWEHMRITQTFSKMSKEIAKISSINEKSFNIKSDDQIIKNNFTKAFIIKQLSNFKYLVSFISNIKHWIFRFIFASTFFKIFLLRNNLVITIVNIFFFLMRFKNDQNMFTHDFSTRTHFEHFNRDEKISIAIQRVSITQQRSQKKLIKFSRRLISIIKRRRFCCLINMMKKKQSFRNENLKERNNVTI